MSSYQKFTLSTFKKKLVDGDYENATGANRAIGKTQELSEGDKAKAKAMVAAHFGTEPAKASPKKKASKKAAKSVKKAAKAKVAKAPAKKAKAKPAKKTVAKPAPDPKPAKKAAKRGKKKASSKRKATATAAAPVAEPEPAAEAPPPARAKPLRAVPQRALKAAAAAPQDATRLEKIQLMGQVITHVDVILRSMELSKKLFPKGDIDQGVQAAQAIMNKAVGELEKAVSSEAEETTNNVPATPAAKTVAKRGKRGLKAVSAPVKSSPLSEPAGGALDLDDPTLTEEERDEIRLARKVRPAVDKRFGDAEDVATA